MTATVNMRMPTNYADMDAKEIEYDGGISAWGWVLIGCGIAFAGGLLVGVGGGTVAGLFGADALADGLAFAGSIMCTVGAGGAVTEIMVYGANKIRDEF